jgi:hypothetical protein
MSKIEKLTEDQLNEIRELGKTKVLKEIARYFKMNVLNFRILREEQPEIDIIYNAIPKEKKYRIYTSEEIIEIEKLAQTLNIESLTKHLKTTMGYFKRSRKQQPELDEALKRAIDSKVRSSLFSQKIKAGKKFLKNEYDMQLKGKKPKPKEQESLFTRVSDDLSPEEAIRRFRRLKAEEKKKNQMRELKAMD